MWFVYFEEENGKVIRTIAVHEDSLRSFITNKDKKWLVTENPFDYNPNLVFDRNGKVFETRLIARP